MPNLGGTELAIILLIAIIVFGAGKVPDAIGQMGKGLREFRKNISGDDS